MDGSKIIGTMLEVEDGLWYDFQSVESNKHMFKNNVCNSSIRKLVNNG